MTAPKRQSSPGQRHGMLLVLRLQEAVLVPGACRYRAHEDSVGETRSRWEGSGDWEPRRQPECVVLQFR